jgi:hypothetical protein
MTLPTDIVFPFRPETFQNPDPKKFQDYMENLLDKLTDMYQQIAQNVNGWIKPWEPSLFGVDDSDVTYVNQFGWIRRSGIMTQLWMDLSWSTLSTTGDLIIQMPYKSANSEGSPWVGVIESVSSNNTFDSGYTYLVWNCTPNTTQGKIIECGSGKTSKALQMANKGGFRGYIEYIGQEFENQ